MDIQEEIKNLKENKQFLVNIANTQLQSVCSNVIKNLVDNAFQNITRPLMEIKKDSNLFPEFEENRLIDKYDFHNHKEIIKRQLLKNEMIAGYIGEGGGKYGTVYYMATTFGRIFKIHQKIKNSVYVVDKILDEICPFTIEFTEIINHSLIRVSQPDDNIKRFKSLINIYKKYNPNVKELYDLEYKKNECLNAMEQLKMETDILEDKKLKLEDDEKHLKKERESFEIEKDNFKKRLKIVVEKEKKIKDCDKLLKVKKLLSKCSYNLLNACNVVDNNLIEDIIFKVNEDLESIFNDDYELSSDMYSDY